MSKASPYSPEEIGKRLKRLRYAWGYGDSPSRWVEWLGDVSKGQWLFYESGQRWLQPDVAIKLCIKTGVSTDWLYLGLEGHNPDAANKRLHRFREMERDHQQLKRASAEERSK
jgi:hypothetical protein